MHYRAFNLGSFMLGNKIDINSHTLHPIVPSESLASADLPRASDWQKSLNLLHRPCRRQTFQNSFESRGIRGIQLHLLWRSLTRLSSEHSAVLAAAWSSGSWWEQVSVQRHWEPINHPIEIWNMDNILRLFGVRWDQLPHSSSIHPLQGLHWAEALRVLTDRESAAAALLATNRAAYTEVGAS